MRDALDATGSAGAVPVDQGLYSYGARLDSQRIYGESSDLMSADDDLHDVVLRAWAAHIAPRLGLYGVELAADAVSAAQKGRTEACARDPRRGVSWEAIGKATGNGSLVGAPAVVPMSTFG
ncbi:hypothetical protein ACIHDR_48655 [Nocardia sp. NPDC052278]|uniref:hypothetical protein n=1 Tax=unclassified Nocardia TaxID=2637762 RepID=UPI00368466D9